jgi:hypothetical protein
MLAKTTALIRPRGDGRGRARKREQGLEQLEAARPGDPFVRLLLPQQYNDAQTIRDFLSRKARRLSIDRDREMPHGVAPRQARAFAANRSKVNCFGFDNTRGQIERAICKIWYLISRTVSDDDPHCGDIDDRSVRL